MKVIAVGFDLHAADKERLASLFKATKLDQWPIKVIDIRYQTEIASEDSVVLLFGDRANNVYRDSLRQAGVFTVSLPPVKNLHPVELGGSHDDRARTYVELCSLVNDLSTGQIRVAEDRKFASTLRPQDLDLSLPVIQSLEKALKESGKSEWTFLTKDGRVVGITTENGKKVDRADISISVHELFLLRAAMDIFKVQEIQVVSNQKS